MTSPTLIISKMASIPLLSADEWKPAPASRLQTRPSFLIKAKSCARCFTLSAYDHSGNLNYFTVLGGISADAFTA